jgi:hypothetical protein
VKRPGRDGSIWVVTHFYMEAMLGISGRRRGFRRKNKFKCMEKIT